jgi:hypothetical protein
MRIPHQKLLWAMAASLALHAGLLSLPPVALPESHAPRVLEARLTKADAPPPLPPLAKPKRQARPRPAPQSDDNPPEVGEIAPPVAPPATVEPPPVTPIPPNEAISPPTVPVDPPPPPSAPPLPARMWLRFDLIRGEQGLVVGRVIHTWQRTGDNYVLTSLAEATGPFSLFVSDQHKQSSSGRIVATGLRPDSFDAQRGKVEKSDAARFDWETRNLQLSSEGNLSSAKLESGTRDMLSFLYQFAFALPERGDIRVDLTNGRKLDSYRYRIVAEEDVETPLGVLKTVHLTKLHDPGEEGTEIWLGMDYHYVPVKIRHTGKQGDRFEQVIAEIRYE